MIFDSHAHYDDEAFDKDREEVIDKIKKSGVSAVLNCSSNMASIEKVFEIVSKHDFIYGALGIHPEFPKDLKGNINKIGDLAQNRKILSIGEIGLDYHYEGYDREAQIKCFKEQMDLARCLNLPVVVHSRDAMEDTLKVLSEFKEVKGALHCFSGSYESAMEAVKLGYYIGFTGVITFKNAKRALEVLEKIPEDRILIETDCPYMAPVPYRGERNDSSYLPYVIEKVSNIRNISYEKACSITYENAARLFNLKVQ
ncbi:TatD DNase family protein [Caloramator quimbayensis]|uniref:TatD DNase family protein n=1 Tax=Caloramator quimbayensis TaxID=1147123 RepID=A0A1T4WHB6_9CLOT|nr:TatD family hydrolase [Caloramator quimbayensis]SKA76724.1 TatD DNase family protein [Caloramator quimbayensis]